MHDQPRRRAISVAIIKALTPRLPASVEAVPGVCVDTPAGLVEPDIVITGVGGASPAPVSEVATAILVGVAGRDRGLRERWSAALVGAGVGCAWRVELDPLPGYRGPLPVIFVRSRSGFTTRERFYFRGVRADVPLVVRPIEGDKPELISVRLDPGDLIPNHKLGLLPGERR